MTTGPATQANLRQAYEASWYTIIGCGGPLSDWTKGYGDMLEEAGIGRPGQWYTATGAAVNTFAAQKGYIEDPYNPDLVFLLFPLDGLNVPKLAIFKVANGDRWFDDVIDNLARNEIA